MKLIVDAKFYNHGSKIEQDVKVKSYFFTIYTDDDYVDHLVIKAVYSYGKGLFSNTQAYPCEKIYSLGLDFFINETLKVIVEE